MGYSVIKSFERGLDTRRLIDTTEAGALLAGRDCHITRGGEIEKRAAFIVTATLPSSTVGLYATRGPVFHTWGIAATAPAGMPPRALYHPAPLSAPDAAVGITAILSVEEFSGKLYVIIKYDNDMVRHWYGDELVLTPSEPSFFVGLPLGSPTPSPTATVPLPGPTPPTSPTPGKPQVSFFLDQRAMPDGTSQLNCIYMIAPGVLQPAPPSEWTEPGGRVRRLMDNMTVYAPYGPHGALNISAYGFPEGYTIFHQGAGGEQQLVSLINSHVSVPDDPEVYATVNAEGRITVWIEKETTQYNGWRLQLLGQLFLYMRDAEGTAYTPVFSGGVDPPPPAPPVPGGPVDRATFVLAHNEKLYATQQQMLVFTALRDPTGWPPAEGSGYIDHTMMAEGMPNLVSLADYGGSLAVFGERHIFIWRMDPDPLKNFKQQVLHRTGTISPHSVVSFGQNEVMYLDRSGIRSLRQREAQDAGFAADLGNNIDELVTTKIKNTSNLQHQYKFWGDVEPTSGRLWMALYDEIFVLSYFPGNQIAAWTWYDASSYPVDMLNATDEHVYWRSGDNVIVYGGESGTEYDTTEAIAQAPYIDAGKPATFKNWTAIDAALYGTWQLRASFDPTAPTTFDLLANVSKSTYAQEKMAINGNSPALSLELRTTFPGPARIGNATLHYEESFSD